MFTDPWGLDEGNEREYRTPEITVYGQKQETEEQRNNREGAESLQRLGINTKTNDRPTVENAKKIEDGRTKIGLVKAEESKSNKKAKTIESARPLAKDVPPNEVTNTKPLPTISSPDVFSNSNVPIDDEIIRKEKAAKRYMDDYIAENGNVSSLGISGAMIGGSGYSGTIAINENNFTNEYMGTTYQHGINGGLDIGIGLYFGRTWYSCPNKFVTPDMLETNSLDKRKRDLPTITSSFTVLPFVSVQVNYGLTLDGISYKTVGIVIGPSITRYSGGVSNTMIIHKKKD